MEFVSKLGPQLGLARVVLEGILAALVGILLLISFIAGRRWYRYRYFCKLNQRTFELCSQWDQIIRGKVPLRSWRLNPFDCEIVESILLDKIEVSNAEALPVLLGCLRSSGLLALRIRQARTLTGWKQRSALVALGRTRAEEALPALAEALYSPSQETQIAAVRGLGRTGLRQGAVPLLERLIVGSLRVPEHTLKNALTSCTQNSPTLLVRYLREATGISRQLIARVMAEVATAELGDDLVLLAMESDPELRASAARALSNGKPSFAIPVLSVLIEDKEWFVRLRAAAALASMPKASIMRPLLRALCDKNRYVRQKAACVLAEMDSNLEDVLVQVIETHDDYALQAFISELERSGAIDKLATLIRKSPDATSAGQNLFDALGTAQRKLEESSKAAAAAAGAK